MEDVDEVMIHPDFLEHIIQINARLTPKLRKRLINFLKENHNCFAWSHEDMIGIDLEVVMHRLQVDTNYPPIKYKRRKFTQDHQ